MSLLQRFLSLAQLEGSTRSVGIMRISLVLLLWSRLGFGVRPIRDLGNPEQLALSVLFYASTCALLVGWRSRLASAGTALSMLLVYYWFGHVRDVEPWTHHHVYVLVICSVLLAFTPSGGSYSVDRWLEVRRAEREGRPIPPERGDVWGLNLFRLQLTALYFWTAYDKTSWAFLSGERMDAIFHTLYLGSDMITGWWWTGFLLASSVGTVVLEYALAFLPWHPRARTPILLIGLVFHGMLYYLLPVATFSATMFMMYLAWYPPDAVHDLLDRLQGGSMRSTPA